MRTRNAFCFLLIGWLSIAVAISFSFALANAESQQDSSASKAETASVVVSVTDESGKGIEGAKATLLKWTGKFERFPQSQPTLKDNRFHFGQIDTEKKYYVYVVADGYASSMQGIFSLTAGETRQLQFKMSRPALAWMDVVDVHGKPVEGAAIERLQYTDANKNDVFLLAENMEALGIACSPSDASGRLHLPPLPRDHKCSVTVVHPDWKSSSIRDVPAADGRLASLTLTPGVKIVCELKQNEQGKVKLDGQKVSVNLSSSTQSLDVLSDLRFEFPVKDDRIEFTVHPVDYEHLSFKMISFFVAPDFANDTMSKDKRLDLGSLSGQKFSLDLKSKITARGRVVDTSGKGVAGVYVATEIAADDTAPWPSERNIGENRFAVSQWASGGNAETDSQGDYEVELSAGKVSLELIREDYFADPVTLEFIMPADNEFKIPEITLFPVPKLRGKVVDSDGQPVSHAYIRMRHSGWGDADPVAESGDDGTFELKLERVPYSAEYWGLLNYVSVVALNAKSDAGGVTVVNLKDAQNCEAIVISLEPRSADWLTDVVKPFPLIPKAEQKKYFAEARQQFPDGVEGKEVPQMQEGTWLNTSAKSLADFRGKFVLLDFWFIGCGPCQREMPSVRSAHRQFADLGFSVVSVHKDGESPKDVQNYADKNGMSYPIVVDDADSTITNQFRKLGVQFFPSYILLDPNGRILHNDATSDGNSLRDHKIEKIYQAIRNARN